MMLLSTRDNSAAKAVAYAASVAEGAMGDLEMSDAADVAAFLTASEKTRSLQCNQCC